MAPIATVKKTIEQNTKRDMKKMGVYRHEYDPIISIYAGMLEQYFKQMHKLEKIDYDSAATTAAGGLKKSPLEASVAALRKDILQYSDRLCLNPKAMKDFEREPEKAESELEKALKGLSGLG